MPWQMLHLSRHGQMLFAEHSPRGSQAVPRLYGSLAMYGSRLSSLEGVLVWMSHPK